MGCMECPILGWDGNNPILGWDVWNFPSWDGMQSSHPGMGCMECPILGWDVNNPILGWDVNTVIPSWDGMSHVCIV